MRRRKEREKSREVDSGEKRRKEYGSRIGKISE